MPTPGTDRSHATEDERPIAHSSYRTIFRSFRSLLANRGYQLRAEGTQGLCGWEPYVKIYNLPGLTTPKGWYKWHKLPNTKAAIDEFLVTVRDVCLTELAAYCKEDPEYRFWVQVMNDFDNPFDPRSKALVQAELELRGWEPPAKSLYGATGQYKVVPSRDMFPAAVQAIDPYELLTLWPRAEAEMVLMFLGRIAAGARGESVYEGDITHTFRQFAITVGRGTLGAGTGKSTFFEYLIDTLKTLGFTVAVLDSQLGRFGWAERALSDLLYYDDLTKELQTKVIRAEQTKTLVSNGYMFTEEKGLKGTKVRARTTFMLCSNSTNPGDLIDLDSGAKSRLCQLDTKTQRELVTPDHDYRIKEHWSTYPYSPEVLMSWLIRCGLDLFLGTCGYQYDSDTKTLYKDGTDTLECKIRSLREELVIKTDLPHVIEVVRAVVHLKAMALAYHKATDNSRRRYQVEATSIGAHTIYLVLRLWLAHKAKFPAELEPFALPSLSRETLGYLKPKMQAFSEAKAAKNANAILDMLISELKSTQGFGYPKGQSTWQGLYDAEAKDLEYLVGSYTPVVKSLYNSWDDLGLAIDDFDKMVAI